jgi:hypothetical protein
VTKRKQHYPTKGMHRLDERDGRLYYGEHDIGPVPMSGMVLRSALLRLGSLPATARRDWARVGHPSHLPLPTLRPLGRRLWLHVVLRGVPPPGTGAAGREVSGRLVKAKLIPGEQG